MQAIWPIPKPVRRTSANPRSYTTPYIELINRAIIENSLTDIEQSKKEVLVDWFKAQDIEGEPLSDNIAKALATIVRLPSSQRGGGKRSW